MTLSYFQQPNMSRQTDFVLNQTPEQKKILKDAIAQKMKQFKFVLEGIAPDANKNVQEDILSKVSENVNSQDEQDSEKEEATRFSVFDPLTNFSQ